MSGGARLTDRVALVTGANRGIGEAIARGLAKEGARVLVASRALEPGERVAAAIRAAGGSAAALALDVADPASIEAAAAAVAKDPGRLDILVNNAGILEDHGVDTEHLGLDVFERTMRVNVRGPLLLTQRFLPLLRRSKHGRIVNMTSGLGCLMEGMSGGYPAYRMSKAALNALSRNLASELEGSGIIVSAVNPGWVKTDMGGPGAPLSVEEGADTALHCCLLEDGSPSGELWEEREPRDW
jgi:NAD(P)-dependent dehydrogenase (short-subunit alcohol dehydrogenase family)